MARNVCFEVMERESWYTIIGAGGDLQEWKDGYQYILNGLEIGTIQEWAEFTGAEMNAEYGLTDNNAYQDDLRFLAFSLEGLDVEKLAIQKIIFCDHWFDDIVANNAERQRQINKAKRRKGATA